MHREIAHLTTTEALERLAHLPGCLLLDSARQIDNASQQPLGRYSFLMADPFEVVTQPVDTKNSLRPIAELLERFKTTAIEGLPPMQGGIAGLFSYDLNRSFENLPKAEHDEFPLPAIAVGAYDVVVAWDHELNKTWIVSQGFPETDRDSQAKKAVRRADFFEKLLSSKPTGRPSLNSDSILDAAELSEQFSVDHPYLERLSSNFSKTNYIETVQKCIDYILAGDVFQINLAQRLLHPAESDSLSLYRRLRKCNPAPFAGYFDLSGITNVAAQIVSASPERFISVRDGLVETRPIKGTRRRTGKPLLDIRERERLLNSEKDRAENTMIVDLMRNDLSRVCSDDSICVRQLCELESYQSVLHLVSAVTGQLTPDATLTDLMSAVFPGGSITGAPKIRAMQIISELESTARGAYCGSLGYLGFDGSADLNILIRTITASRGWWQIPVGGGIVVQSNPQAEYQETWTKAASMLQAIRSITNAR